MRDVALFVEDAAQQKTMAALVERVAREKDVEVNLSILNSVGGRGKVETQFKSFLRDIERGILAKPDLVVLGTDGNCKGHTQRAKDFGELPDYIPVVMAIPDPHIERWLLLDGAAFKAVLGQGCQAPDRKCERDRYKQILVREIRAAGIRPSLGGIEFVEEIVEQMDLERAAGADPSLKSFLDDLTRHL